ncbi:BTAD domain-containing putative transcriptional regulator [Amycolatopsis sp. La24]|uniref:BTAD domain-containing putative transcriptional regulator n=1 Tax=Amycolatopsis sp. La24 TaxID=3028304 RepID=UPI0023AE7B79|nr:BTAD domain-containing putative transcriptional regulator [Amycolatopsis sp. La24]
MTALRLRGAAAATALLAVVAGVPVGLVELNASPARLLPREALGQVPLAQLPERLWTAVRWAWLTGDLVAWLLVAVAWSGWLVLTVAIAAESIRQIRYGIHGVSDQVYRLPLFRWISGLVAAALLTLSGSTMSAAAALAAPVAATAPPHPGPSPDGATAHGTSPAATATEGSAVPYVVAHGDTLWGLAARHLGYGARYHEIAQLNPVLLSANPDLLEPGWRLWLPADAVNLPAPPETTADGRVVEVRPGDTLSQIAERELGDSTAWPAIAALNFNRIQPDGRTFRHPDHVMPGWTLVLPELHTPADTPGQPTPSKTVPAPVRPPILANPPTLQPDEHRAPDHEASADGISLPTGGFVGLGLAALITIAATVVRLNRRRRYRPGAHEPPDPTSQPVVRALRVAIDAAPPGETVRGKPADVAVRERALATARKAIRTDGTTVVGVRDGQAIALDLARTRGLGLTGPGAAAAARALTTALLAQSSCDDGALQIVASAAGARHLFDNALPDRLPAQLCIVDSASDALDVMETQLLTRSHRLHAQHSNYPAALCLLVAESLRDTDRRIRAVLESGAHLGLAGLLLGSWPGGATVHVSGDGTVETSNPATHDLAGTRLFTLPSADAHHLLALLEAAQSKPDERHTQRPAAAQMPGDAAAKQPERFVREYEFIPSELQRGAELGTTADKTVAAPARDEPEPDSAPSPNPTPASSGDKSLHLFVLGRLRLTCGVLDDRDIIDTFTPKQQEFLTYLALHPDGCRRDTVNVALWPDAPRTRPYNSFHASLSQMRRALREATGGDLNDIIVRRGSRYGLDPATMTVDLWQLYDELAVGRRHDRPADAAGALRRATELYRGDIAEDSLSEWLVGPREALRREVLDAFSLLVRTTRTDDAEGALALLERARALDPYNEAIYRDLMRLQTQLGQHDSILRTLQLLRTSLVDIDQEVDDDTISLANELVRTGFPQRGRRAS